MVLPKTPKLKPALRTLQPKPREESIAARVLARTQATIFYKVHAMLGEQIGDMMKYQHLIKHPTYEKEWNVSTANELGRSMQGVGIRVKGKDTIYFIHKAEVLADWSKDVICILLLCELHQ